MTSFHAIRDDPKNAEARRANSAVVRDGNGGTTREPSDILSFNLAMVDLFEKARPRLEAPAP